MYVLSLQFDRLMNSLCDSNRKDYNLVLAKPACGVCYILFGPIMLQSVPDVEGHPYAKAVG